MESLLELSRRALLTGSAAGATGWLVMRSGSGSARAQRMDLEVALPDADARVLRLPKRRADAPSGSEFLDQLEAVPLDELDERVIEEVLAGNVPASFRELARVEGVWVTRDYLSVGSDDDHVRVPLTGPGAQRLANALGATLPTPELVDAIHRAADVRLPAIGVEEEPDLHWVAQVQRHEELLASHAVEIASHAVKPIVAGHLKDIVIARIEAPDRVAVYGLHGTLERPMQPLSTIHDRVYVDYSHGVRLVIAD